MVLYRRRVTLTLRRRRPLRVLPPVRRYRLGTGRIARMDHKKYHYMFDLRAILADA